jgi:hypothetical protein
MGWRASPTRSRWWALSAAGVAAAAAVAGRAYINPWLFGSLLLIAWGLLAYGLTVLRVKRSLRQLLTATWLALAFVVWNHTAPQPRMQMNGVRLRTFPSTVSPGVVELVIHNSGSLPAHVVAFPVADLAPLFTTARELAAGGVEAELSERLERADRLPSQGTMMIPAGQNARVNVDIPPSQRAWHIGRGEVTVLVAARLRYRDRVFLREKAFCLFGSAPNGQWLECPFLNE